jgi:hypothetical protein
MVSLLGDGAAIMTAFETWDGAGSAFSTSADAETGTSFVPEGL